MARRAIALIGALAGCARSRPTPVVAPPVVAELDPTAPLASWFGIWNDETGDFERRSRIDRTAGVTFGWRIKTRCTGPLRFREVMRLPAPGDWSELGDLPGTTLSDDQASTTTVDYAACKQGWVEHQWTVAANDPAGTYVITVELAGYATQTFRPKFVTPAPSP